MSYYKLAKMSNVIQEKIKDQQSHCTVNHNSPHYEEKNSVREFGHCRCCGVVGLRCFVVGFLTEKTEGFKIKLSKLDLCGNRIPW